MEHLTEIEEQLKRRKVRKREIVELRKVYMKKIKSIFKLHSYNVRPKIN